MTAPAALATARLRLRPFALADAPFALRLVTEPSFVRFIGDKGVRDLDGARRYLRDGPLACYAAHGFGLLRVALFDDTPVGMCGLLRRAELDAPDLGFAFVPEATGLGYAREAAAAVLDHARAELGVDRVLAITTADNERSLALLAALGFAPAGTVRLGVEGPDLRRLEWRVGRAPR